MDKDRPMVSVCMITYNHEEYISRAIDGVLAQQTDFSIELVIGEDCSTDKTASIISGYVERYPALINTVFRKVNMGALPNFLDTLKLCTGRYIAVCEGDDYWIDSLKLQKQVDFLEQNPDYSLCFHNFFYLADGSLKLASLFHGDAISFDDYAGAQEGIQTLTVLFRNIVKPVVGKKILSKIRGSKVLFLQLAELGKMKYLPEPMAVYRIHAGGIWSGANIMNKAKMALENIEAMALYYRANPKTRNLIRTAYTRTSFNFINSCFRQNEFSHAFRVFILSLSHGAAVFDFGFIFYYVYRISIKRKF